MRAALLAGLAYFAVVFAVAFVTGVVRTLGLEQGLGLSRLQAVAAEAPVILATSFVACRSLLRRFRVRSERASRLTMTLTAFALLFSAEVALGLLLGKSLAVQLAEAWTAAGALGLTAQFIFVAMPLLIRRD